MGGSDKILKKEEIEGLEQVQKRKRSWGRVWSTRSWLRELEVLSCEKRGLRGDLIAFYKSLK